jgi:hypothetical protein
VVLFEAFRQRRNVAHRVQKTVAPTASTWVGPTAGVKPKKQKGLGS